MKIKLNWNRLTFSSVLAFKRILLGCILLSAAALFARPKVNIEEFRVSGSADIIISPMELTRLLWKNIGNNDSYELYFGKANLAKDSFAVVVSGSCQLERNNSFRISWKISQPHSTTVYKFKHNGSGFDKARKALFASLDSVFVPLSITTDPDSLDITINGIYKGKTPIHSELYPIGSYKLKLSGSKGLIVIDSFTLTKAKKVFHFSLKKEPSAEFAYLRLLTPPECVIYLTRPSLTSTTPVFEKSVSVNSLPLVAKNGVYTFAPGQVGLTLVSRQYGVRNVSLNLIAGDTLKISFFNHKLY